MEKEGKIRKERKKIWSVWMKRTAAYLMTLNGIEVLKIGQIFKTLLIKKEITNKFKK